MWSVESGRPHERVVRKPLRSSDSFSRFQEISELIAQRNMSAALDACDRAIDAGTDPLELVHARWQCFMLLGEFHNAWCESDRILQSHTSVSDPNLPRHLRRIWNGTPLDGQQVLVRCYHGLGDTIQFSRFLPILKKRAAEIKVQCQAPLASLLESIVSRSELVLLDQEPEPAFDSEIDIMELAHLLRTTISTIPREVPYLKVNAELVEKFREKCDCSGLRVGLVWCSGNWDPTRNIGLDLLDGLRKIPGVNFFCLQRCVAFDQVNSAATFPFHYAESNDGTLLDTAALISNLDLMITVDTMVAHLAGALGKPTWLLLPFCADWRWMLYRIDSPWYPTMRLFRQTLAGNWGSVIEQIKCELELYRAVSSQGSAR